MTTVKDVIFEVGAAIAPVLIDILNMVIPIIAAGNWELAAQIMWKALQIAWQAGIGKIMTIWTGFKMGVFEIFDSLITGIRSVWNSITTWIADKIAWIIGGVSKLIESITGFQLIADTTMADMRKAIQEDNAVFQQQLEEGRARRTNERDQAVMQVQQQYDTGGLQGELDELNKLTKQAAQERTTAEIEAAQKKEFQKQQFTLDTEDLMAQAAGSTGKADAVLGTFSGATAGQQIGATSVWNDIAKSNREIAEASRKTEKNTREKAGWFAT